MLSEKPWKLERTVLVLLVVVACFCFFSVVGGAILHAEGRKKPDENSLVDLLVITLVIHGSIIAAVAVALKRFNLSPGQAFGFSTPGKIRAMLMGLFAAIIFQPLSWILQTASALLLELCHLNVSKQEALNTLDRAQSWDSRTYFIIFSVLIAPFAEEVLFRGILYPAVKQAGFPILAFVGNAVLFAAIHHNLPIFIPLIALGLMMTWLYEHTDNLLAPITAHAAFNGISVILVNLQNHFQHAAQ